MMTQRLRARLITTAVLALVFAAGFSLGLAVDRDVGAAEERDRPEASTTADRDGHGRSGPGRVVKRLDLSREQREQVDSLLRQYREEMGGLQKEYMPRYWEIVDTSRSRVKNVLTEEQAVLYDSLLLDNDRRRGRPGAEDRKH